MADITSSILSSLLSSSNIKNIGKAADASTDDVKSVLTNAVPALLQGASAQASNKSTAEGFLQAITNHANDKSDSIDVADGAKIISHLLGSTEKKETTAVAKASGVSSGTTKSILSAAAPLLLNVLGNQTNASSSNSNAIASLLSSVVSNNMGSILTGLLGGSSSSSSSSGKKKTSSLAGILGNLLK